MSVINLYGAETGTTADCLSVNGTGSIDSSIKKTGAYSHRINPTTTATGRFRLGTYDTTGVHGLFDKADVYVTFHFRVDTLPASGNEEIIRFLTSGGSTKFTVRITSAGNLQAYQSGGTTQIGSDGATALSTATWYRISIRVGTGNPASWEIKINGATELSGSSNINTSNNAQIDFGKMTDRSSQSVDYYYDNIVIDDAAYSAATDIELMAPNADGTYATWGSGAGTADYTSLDEVPHDSATTYLLSTLNVGDAECPNLESAASAGISGTVVAVKAVAVVARNVGNGGVLLRTRYGSTDIDNFEFTTLAAYTMLAAIHALTLSDIDTLQVGAVEQNISNASRLTAAYAVVAFTPSTGPTAKIHRGMNTRFQDLEGRVGA